MPFNLKTNNTAEFGVQFIDAYDVAYTPSSASITLVYDINGVSNSSSLDLASSGGRWVANWSSVGVDVPSDVTWTVVSSCYAGPAQLGTIRIIERFTP